MRANIFFLISYVLLANSIFAGELIYNKELDNSVRVDDYHLLGANLYEIKISDTDPINPNYKFITDNEGEEGKRSYLEHRKKVKSFILNNVYTDLGKIPNKKKPVIKDTLDHKDRLEGIIASPIGSDTDTIKRALDLYNQDSYYITKRFDTADAYRNNFFVKDEYKNDKALNILSSGNSNHYSKRDSYTQNLINIMSPNLKLNFRTGIMAARDIYGKGKNKMYQTDSPDVYYGRSFTVLARVGLNKYGLTGSSFASPIVARLAYEIKQKYPFLTYSQVKQVILTTAHTGRYLDNKDGWGEINPAKALKGIASLNAGLIDEQRFYIGMLDKIYDDEGNTYFWLDIPNKGENYWWDNDIDSGLKGDGNSGDYDVFTDNDFRRDFIDSTKYTASLYFKKVLPSEKRLYANIAKAGLRKAGKGTIILRGRQKYETKTQILQGTLQLENKSESTYEVFKNGAFILNADNIHLKKVVVDGKFSIYGDNVTIDELILSDTGSLSLKGKRATIKKLVLNNNEDINENVNRIKNDFKVDFVYSFKSNNEDGSYLKDVKVNNRIYESIPKIENSYKVYLEDEFTKLKDLPYEIKQNIPSFNPNIGDFGSVFKFKNPRELSLWYGGLKGEEFEIDAVTDANIYYKDRIVRNNEEIYERIREKIEEFKINGEKEEKHDNGDREVLTYINGIKQKYVYYYKNGDREEGHYVNGKVEGKFVYYYKDGREETIRVKGKREGQYTIYYNSGDREEGSYINGKREGKFTYYYRNGDREEGYYVNSERKGKFIYYYSDGREEFTYIKGKQEGKFTIYHDNGDKEEGSYTNGKREGKFTYYYRNGDREEGTYIKGKRVGKYVYYFSDGEAHSGYYVKGERQW